MADSPLTPVANETFGLPELLATLRRDLQAAQEAVPPGDAIFFLGDAEIEVAFTIEQSNEAGGGLNLKVFGVGFDGSAKGATAQTYANTIKLTLKPAGDIAATYGIVGPTPTLDPAGETVTDE